MHALHSLRGPWLDHVQLLCLDAGNTVVFLDHAVVAQIAGARVNTVLDVSALQRAEGEAKRRLEPGAPPLEAPVNDPRIPETWGRFVRTLLTLAYPALTPAQTHDAVLALWDEHAVFNLWRRVPEGLIDALARLRAAGIPVAIVSNSEGMLLDLFARTGLQDSFDLVLDSGVLGVEKPDPAIFRLALERFHVAPEHALHLGDTIATDVIGARNAGVHVALIDPFGHCEGRMLDVPRVPDVVAVVNALLDLRGNKPVNA